MRFREDWAGDEDSGTCERMRAAAESLHTRRCAETITKIASDLIHLAMPPLTGARHMFKS
eukprot:768726-Hanusia_phi.AAC.10